MEPKFTISSDPEFPIVQSDGTFVSSIGLIGGSKQEPRQTEHGFIQEDNVMVEVNPIPATTREQFIINHVLMMSDVEAILKPLDLEARIEATAVYDDEFLRHPLARQAGCDPDYDAWSLTPNSPPDLSATNLRSAGGHIHVGFDWANNDPFNRANLARVFDIVGTLPSVLLDKNAERRSLYGKPGCHRPKSTERSDPYDGVELRTLSNFWLGSEELMGWAYDRVAECFVRYDEMLEVANDSEYVSTIISAINNSDEKTAAAICSELVLGGA